MLNHPWPNLPFSKIANFGQITNRDILSESRDLPWLVTVTKSRLSENAEMANNKIRLREEQIIFPRGNRYTVAETELSPLTMRTEQPALPTTFSVALPVNIFSIAVFTGIPMIMRSTPLPPAVSTITS